MGKRKLARVTASFFALMLCFTLLSRAADSASVAVVTGVLPSSRMLTHTVEAAGKIEQNQDLAVTTVENLRVRAIAVREGESVAKGDLLFELDTAYLEEQILYQKQELEKQDLTVADARSRQDVSDQQKENEQAAASEQYALSVEKANTQLARARETLEEAKNALKEYRNQKGTGETGDSSSVETELERAVEEKTQAYVDAQQELVSVQWKIENAVNTALQNLQGRASLLPSSSVKTNSEGEEPEETAAAQMETAGVQTGSVRTQTEPGSAQTEAAGIQTETTGVQTEAAVTQTEPGSVQIEAVSTETETADTEAGMGETSGAPEDQDVILPGEEEITESEGASGETLQAPTQAELDQAEAAVRSSYQAELAAAEAAVEQAKQEKEKAQEALAQYQQERLDASGAAASEKESQLIAEVKAAQEAWEDAAMAANEAAVTAGRTVAGAGIPNASDSTALSQQITYEQMQLTLDKLEALREADGKVCAPADGRITQVNLTTGGKTTDLTAILMADTSRGFQFAAELTKEEQKYIGSGDTVTLSGNREQTDLTVDSVTADEENPDLYHITVQIPDGSFALGEAVTMTYAKKSSVYALCVPLSALYIDEKNEAYVLVADEYDTVLGTEMRARKVSVTVLEKDDTYAALQEGALSSGQTVISGSDKAISDGSRVRVSSGT